MVLSNKLLHRYCDCLAKLPIQAFVLSANFWMKSPETNHVNTWSFHRDQWHLTRFWDTLTFNEFWRNWFEWTWEFGSCCILFLKKFANLAFRVSPPLIWSAGLYQTEVKERLSWTGERKCPKKWTCCHMVKVSVEFVYIFGGIYCALFYSVTIYTILYYGWFLLVVYACDCD